MHLPSRVTSASQELHGLSCATVGTTSPSWAQTPAFHVHQAPIAHILALRYPGPVQHMLTAKLVCIEASAPHPHRPSHPTSCLISFTLSYQTLSMPPCTKILCECIQPPAFSPWPASCLFSLSITGFSSSDPMLYLHLFPKGGHLAHNTKSSPWVYREVRGNPGYRRVPVHQDNKARVSTLTTRAMAMIRRW